MHTIPDVNKKLQLLYYPFCRMNMALWGTEHDDKLKALLSSAVLHITADDDGQVTEIFKGELPTVDTRTVGTIIRAWTYYIEKSILDYLRKTGSEGKNVYHITFCIEDIVFEVEGHWDAETKEYAFERVGEYLNARELKNVFVKRLGLTENTPLVIESKIAGLHRAALEAIFTTHVKRADLVEALSVNITWQYLLEGEDEHTQLLKTDPQVYTRESRQFYKVVNPRVSPMNVVVSDVTATTIAIIDYILMTHEHGDKPYRFKVTLLAFGEPISHADIFFDDPLWLTIQHANHVGFRKAQREAYRKLRS